MRPVDFLDLGIVSGGNLYPAITAGVAIYTAWPSVVDSTSYWGGVGQNIGGWAYGATHPNELGQMTFDAGDFGYSFITPAFPDEFPPYGNGFG